MEENESFYEQHLGDVRESVIAKLRKRALSYSEYAEDEDVTFDVATRFAHNMDTDSEWGWDGLIPRYLDGSEEKRRTIDRTFVALSGYSLAHYLNEALKEQSLL